MAALRAPRVLSFKIGQRLIVVPTIPVVIAGVFTIFLLFTLSGSDGSVKEYVSSFVPHLKTPEPNPDWYYKPGTTFLAGTNNPLYGLERTNSPFLVKPEQFPPHPLKKHLPDSFKVPDYVPPPVAPKTTEMRVPNAVHYVYGLKPPKSGYDGEQLPYYAYLAMKSAIQRLKPEKTFFYYKYKPTGPFWDLIEPYLTLIEIEPPSNIFGNKLTHFAHKADIVRLYALKGSGGIYLDVDVYVLRDFDDLLGYPTTMGMERSPNSDRDELDAGGLCNGIIIAEPESPFVDRWLNEYHQFRDGGWAELSVHKPWELAQYNPEEIQVLNPRAMYWPMWHGNEVDKVHQLDEYDFHSTGQYSYHGWESLAMKYLIALTPESIRNVDTSFHRLVRPLIGPEDDEAYAKWAAEQARREGK